MKLFLFDDKHDKIIDAMELGIRSTEEIILINQVIDFLQKNEILDCYEDLTIANNAEVKYTEDDFSYLSFS